MHGSVHAMVHIMIRQVYIQLFYHQITEDMPYKEDNVVQVLVPHRFYLKMLQKVFVMLLLHHDIYKHLQGHSPKLHLSYFFHQLQ